MIKPEVVRKSRKSKNMTQAEFAEYMGISCCKLRKHWETHGIPTAEVDRSRKIVEVFTNTKRDEQ